MNVFHVCYFLSKACLGEINNNFQRIYFSCNDKYIQFYFILKKEIEEDIENIEQEIMSELELIISNFLDASYIENSYIFKHQIIINDQKDFYLNYAEDGGSIEEFYRRDLDLNS